ncbi:PH 6 domain containing protein [Pyrenophora tritici-repentis]|nr:uncharacterized protein PTRG_00691 [Pyrenophora tritici-repentis Pt-1C-BFP]KAI0570381.1 PH-6 domain-containing protein [Pyrenophora tritici-repentis]EDU40129.1 hypothetical protein PTRG_00691 [Pyrenophora tritici-repentis Pt-1C-BFP]KAI0619706.1 PH-6 domain-containing protein [Pyrenophora tritici-repentis]KAI1520580.1 PH-6 domain containing protein [Pyrenophora tritici-repentis]KAI1675055.1 PH-6 domain containing protein [Pyrenophora tritici-repentis]
MSTPVDAPKPVEVPDVGTAGTVEPAPAPVVASDNTAAPAEAPVTDEAPKVEGEAAAPTEEVAETKEEDKVVTPIESGALGYKAPGLKNAFRFSKKYFWLGEEPVPAENLREYLRGEKPEVAHSVAAWSSQTGKGLLFFVKHADHKEHPAGVLNLAYATDLAKDGAVAFAFKVSGHKHAFEAQTAAERDGWFVAIERAITEAKASKDGIETSDAYKEAKEKISKPAALAGATSSAPKKSMDAAPKLAEAESPAAAEASAAPARTGSSSSSSSDEAKAKKAKNKSRSVSRGKRASLFGGLLGKKDKEHKEESEAVKDDAEAKKEDGTTAPQLDEVPTSAPVNANDVVKPADETTEPTAVVAAPEDAAKVDETPAPVVAQEKPKPTKRASIFGNFVEKLKSPTTEKKESEAALAPATVKETETTEASKPLEEAEVAAPVAAEGAATETTETKPVAAVSTPGKEKEHFSFGKLFGSKDRAKSPAPESKVDAAAPKIEDASATPAVAEPAPVEAAPVAAETKPEEATPATEAPKADKRKSFFGNLSRSLSKATGGKTQPKDKKDAASPAPVVEEETTAAPVEEKKEETAVPAVGDVPAENISVGDASKSANPTVATTA